MRKAVILSILLSFCVLPCFAQEDSYKITFTLTQKVIDGFAAQTQYQKTVTNEQGQAVPNPLTPQDHLKKIILQAIVDNAAAGTANIRALESFNAEKEKAKNEVTAEAVCAVETIKAE